MKVEFKNIPKYLDKRIFFLYGNYKLTLDVFTEYIINKLKEKKFSVEIYKYSITEYGKLLNSSQNNLFSDVIKCYCLRGLEDKHLNIIKTLSKEQGIFILESGEFFKSKQITEFTQKDEEIVSIASFYNDLTLLSLCQLLFPQKSPAIYDEIVNIIKETDEGLLSLFKKLSLLLEDNNQQDLINYVKHKKSFLNELDFIPIVRYALQAALKENIFHQNQNYTKMNLSNKIHFLLDAERKQKMLYPLSKSYLIENLK